jgi:hypothetical protein
LRLVRRKKRKTRGNLPRVSYFTLDLTSRALLRKLIDLASTSGCSTRCARARSNDEEDSKAHCGRTHYRTNYNPRNSSSR